MKATSIVICVTAAAFALSSCGQGIAEKKLPSVVVNAVKTKYGNATNIEWEKRTNGYEAEFLQGQTELTVLVDNAGNLLMQKQDVDSTAIPVPVMNAINTNHPGYTIDDAEKLEKAGVSYYQLEIEKKGNKDLKLVFTADGKPANGVEYWD